VSLLHDVGDLNFPNSRGPLLFRCARTVARPDRRLGGIQVNQVFVYESLLSGGMVYFCPGEPEF
jgi:hypothetical protein